MPKIPVPRTAAPEGGDESRPWGGDAHHDGAGIRARVAASVRELRSRAGWSLGELATEAGIGKSTLHAVESGEANPGIETLWALSRALNVPFGELIEPAAPSIRVLRRRDVPRIVSETSRTEALLLASTGPASRLDWYEVVLPAGAGSSPDAHPSGTVEHLLVLEGLMTVGPVGSAVELLPGDLASLPGDRPHRYGARRDSRALLLVQYP